MDFFWVVKLPRLHHAQLWRVFSFKYRSMALCMILRDSSPWVSVSFGDLGLKLYTQDLVKSLAPPFVSTRSFIQYFVELVERLRMFIHSAKDKVFYCFVWNYQEPGNMYMYLLEMTLNLLLCGFRFFMLYWTRLEQMSKEKKFVKMDTECWKLLLK